jgi:poly-gamma-glutamate system protein
MKELGGITAAQEDRDPGRTCLLGMNGDGSPFTPLVNAGGSATAKQRAINPNYAAVFVDWLQELGLDRGDPVAVTLTGSYPGTNVALYAAMETMGLRPVVITSVCGSGYGATRPDFTWLDMERVLDERNVINIRSVAASAGGARDVGETLTPEGLAQVWRAVARNDVQPLKPEDLDDSIDSRMRIYEREARGDRYKAYINVGGATPSLGVSLSEAIDLYGIRTGLIRDLWRMSSKWHKKGTMIRMASGGTPVIHVGETLPLARRYGFSTSHRELKRIPEVGEGTALRAATYKPAIALGLLVVYVALLVALVMPSSRQRIFGKPDAAPIPGR